MLLHSGLRKPAKFPGPGKLPPANQLADSPEFAAKVEAAVIDYLNKLPAKQAYLPRLGIYLRARSLTPQDGLKKFLSARPDLFYFTDEGNGTHVVRLVHNADDPSTFGGGYQLPPGVDEKTLERQLVTFILETETSENPVNMPLLGEYCIKHLGFSMKGFLHRFLLTRKHLFRLPDDGRQHVLLVPGAVEAVGAVGSLPDLPEDIFGDNFMEDGNNSSFKMTQSSLNGSAKQFTPSTLNNNNNHQSRHPDYPKWDRLTQEMYDYVLSRGGSASFKDVDSHMKTRCRDLIIASGIQPGFWQAAKLSWKRRNIFKKEGNLLAVHVVPTATTTNNNNNNSASLRVNGGGGGRLNNSNIEDEQGNGSLNQRIIPVPVGSKVTLETFQSERKAMEALRDEIHSNLSSLKSLSDLQKENAGLRAACVTLGRELLALKEDVAALKAHLNIGPSFAGLNLDNSPSSSATTAFGSGSMNAAKSFNTDDAYLRSIIDSALGEESSSTSGGGGNHSGAASIVIIGGHDSVSWLDSIEVYHPSALLEDDQWTSGTSMPAPRSFCAAAASPDGSLYVIGGGNGIEWYDSAMRLPSGGSEWQKIASMSIPRGSMAAAFSNGYLYAFGGGKPGQQYNLVEWYDPQRDSWMAGPQMTTRRFAVSGSALNGILYAVGGYDGTEYLSTVERLDPREGRWTPVASMHGQRGGHSCIATGNIQVYAFGGYSKAAIQHCEVYDARAESWRPIAPLSECRAYGTAAAAGNSDNCDVFVLGGLRSDMQTHAPLIERYSPMTDSWVEIEIPAIVNPRRSFLAACTML